MLIETLQPDFTAAGKLYGSASTESFKKMYGNTLKKTESIISEDDGAAVSSTPNTHQKRKAEDEEGMETPKSAKTPKKSPQKKEKNVMEGPKAPKGTPANKKQAVVKVEEEEQITGHGEKEKGISNGGLAGEVTMDSMFGGDEVEDGELV